MMYFSRIISKMKSITEYQINTFCIKMRANNIINVLQLFYMKTLYITFIEILIDVIILKIFQ